MGGHVTQGENSGISVKEFWALLRRQLWIIVGIAVLAAIGAYAYASTRTPMYAASAQLLYQAATDPTNPSSATGYVDPNAQQLRVEAATTIIAGPETAKRVESSLGSSSEWPSYSMQATVTSPGSSSGSSYSTGVTISVQSPDAGWTAKLANAYANAFIRWGAETQSTAYSDAAEIVRTQIKEMSTPEQKASSQYAILQERLRNLEVRAALATGDFVLVVPATVPSEPYAPTPTKSALMALAVGLVVGLGVAFLREKLDTRVRSYKDVADLLGLSVVGRVPAIPHEKLSRGPLVILSDSDGPAANSIRRIRTNLDFVSMGREHRSLMIASALPGEGKSLTVANLAVSLALAGKDVILVDADLRRPRIHQAFGLQNTSGVSSVIAGMTTVKGAMQEYLPLERSVIVGHPPDAAPTTVNLNRLPARLRVLTSGPRPPNPGEMVASEKFSQVIAELKQMQHDYLLVDSPAFLSIGDASAVATNVDGLVLVVNLRLTRRPILEEVREFLQPMPTQTLGVIVVGEKPADQYHYYAEGHQS